MPGSELKLGREVASVLRGAWRPSSSEVCSAALPRLSPLLMAGGTGALMWFRIRQQQTKFPQPVAEFYHNTYIEYALRAALHEAELQRLSEALNTAGIRSIVLKGWSLARLYPQTGLRPSGDIDLWVDPEQRASTERLLRDLEIKQAVDLEHDQLRRFETRSFSDFYSCCEVAHLGPTPLKVLRREDQIRFACLHFVKHGGWRSIWLCDIAVLLESHQGTFDWARCFGTNARHARWIGSVIGLAVELLGASIPDGAPASLGVMAPTWLKRTVLQEWSRSTPPSVPSLSYLLRASIAQGYTARDVLRGRWRNSIQATIDCDGPFNAMPRWPYQGLDAARRTMQFCYRFLNSRNSAAERPDADGRSSGRCA